MRLRTIKLSGFKSFVDPATLTLPGNLVGIVGPNGCGKSNIIDAVMWVMGESSAKHLRGDALVDVIFNGSSARNPVGQASVELIFDNTEHKLGGQYASYDEISIKRQITRDATSSYFLNGTRCRRRDIQAIFLGTGLGPRSYAIIEQGMISRLIEAKPDELRTFIEEAAGISRYRERRRETENRIGHTRENIARLNDIREELDRQLNHLQRQARAAERYQKLMKEKRQLEAESQALQWKFLKQQSDREEAEARTRENSVEAGMAELRSLEAGLERTRHALSAANDHFNAAQSDYYRIGGEISQLEQKLQHAGERIAATEQDLGRARQEVQAARDQLRQDQEKFTTLRDGTAHLEPELQLSRDEGDRAYLLLNQSEQAMQAWQGEWEGFNETVASRVREKEINTLRCEHLEFGLEESVQRIRSLVHELEAIDRNALEAAVEDQAREVRTLEETLAGLQAQAVDIRQKWNSARNTELKLLERLNERRLQHQRLEDGVVSLEALQQQAAHEQDRPEINAWLAETGLSNQPRLSQQIAVDAEWTRPVEIVLRQFLHDICVDDVEQLTGKLDEIESGTLGIVGIACTPDTGTGDRLPSLADKIKGPFPLKHLLAEVLIAEDSETAVNMRGRLRGMESVITRDGLWLGRNWSRVCRPKGAPAGILDRKRQITGLREEIVSSAERLEALETEAIQEHGVVETLEAQLQEMQAAVQAQHSILSERRASLAAATAQRDQARSRIEHILAEQDELQQQAVEDERELSAVREDLQRLNRELATLEQRRAGLAELRDQHRESLRQARDRWQKTHEESHGIALQLEAISSQRASLEQAMERCRSQIARLEEHCADLQKLLSESGAPLGGMREALDRKLGEKSIAESALAEARQCVQQVEAELRELEQARTRQEHHIQELRDELEKARLLTRESRVRLQTIEENLKTAGHDVQLILSALAENTDQETWRERIESVNQKIQRLGPVNLAAIGEYDQLAERKSYLDRQDADLREALATLENAIRRIDRESRARFKETFDQLNANLRETFPQLFGGGNAYLELTGSDLLDTGVTIMARPPGKRNSTIHLLSGGEKALTAVALVFSIFKLNPAPFCILDEVDAPLDDANIGRFSELLLSMSEEIQFIFITHNKITMEIAYQLLGVTMQEPGVSRLVTVDVDEAVQMAATA